MLLGIVSSFSLLRKGEDCDKDKPSTFDNKACQNKTGRGEKGEDHKFSKAYPSLVRNVFGWHHRLILLMWILCLPFFSRCVFVRNNAMFLVAA